MKSGLIMLLLPAFAGCVQEPPKYSITYNPPRAPAVTGAPDAGAVGAGTRSTSVAPDSSIAAGQGSFAQTNGTNSIYTAAGNGTATKPPSSDRIYSEATNRVPLNATPPADLPPTRPDPRRGVQDQGLTDADRALVLAIRQAWIDDAALATSAPGVKIFAGDGKVVLTGSTPTENEKLTLESVAKRTHGVVSVDDRLDVVPPR